MWLRNAMRNWRRRGPADEQLDEELREYVELLAAEKMGSGMTPERARREAKMELGGLEQVKEQVREARAGHLLETLRRDWWFAGRMLRKSPGFSAVAMLTLALGIGANTAIFSVVEAILLRPLPFREPGQLMVVWHTPPQKSFPGIPRFVVSPANYLDWQRENHVFGQMSAMGFGSFNLTGLGEPEPVQGRRVSSEFFSLLRVSPIAGRSFAAEEDQAGHGNVVVVGYAFCQSHFGGIKNGLGKRIQLDGQSYTVIGVMPAKFDFPFRAQLWMPLAWTDKQRAVRGNHGYIVIARLKPGVSQSKAQAQMDAIASRLAQQYPTDDAGWGAEVAPLRDLVAGSVGPALLVLLGGVAFVLLVACANVASLTLAKGLRRRKEIAIRTALGASRGRVMRQVLSETVLLSAAGGTLALVLAHFVISAIAAFIGPQLPVSIYMGLDAPVLAFTFVVCLLTVLVAGVAPAWHLSKTNLNESLKQGAGKLSGDSGGHQVRNALIVSEVALSLVLLTGAGLMIRTLYLLRSSDPGIDAHNVLTVPLAISKTKYSSAAQQTNFFQTTLKRVRGLPGVASAGAVDSLPLQGGSMQPVQVEGQPVVPMADQPEVAVRLISPGYLSAMRIRLEQGRDFTDADQAGAQTVVLVSESFAKRFWPQQNPLGKHVGLTFSSGPSRAVIGVVGDVKVHGLDSTLPVEAVYQAMLQNTETTQMTLALRTNLPPTSLNSAVRDAIHGVDADEPVAGVLTMGDVVDQSLVQHRLTMILLAAFAGMAVLLAALGIYGVQAYTVRQHVRELAIRIALGAQRTEVFRLIIGQGLKLTAIGIGIGLAAALGLTRLMASQLYGLSATDPLTFAGVVMVLTMVAVAACYIPARRAMCIDPMAALRHE